MIKAIETKYKNCRFRSRLEARWAVFFDVLRIQWEYEKEGYELPSGKYLPDFWLPELYYGEGAWAEVKPTKFSTREATLCAQLALGGNPVLLLDGLPDNREYLCIEKLEYEHGGYTGEFGSFGINGPWGPVTSSGFWGMAGDYEKPILEEKDVEAIEESLGVREFIMGNKRAIEVARSSRFEHGETPRV